DGIRYFHVTGVQTCALPIYRHLFESMAVWSLCRFTPMLVFCITELIFLKSTGSGARRRRGMNSRRWRFGFKMVSVGQARRILGRSEERRVGKECRTGW